MVFIAADVCVGVYEVTIIWSVCPVLPNLCQVYNSRKHSIIISQTQMYTKLDKLIGCGVVMYLAILWSDQSAFAVKLPDQSIRHQLLRASASNSVVNTLSWLSRMSSQAFPYMVTCHLFQRALHMYLSWYESAKVSWWINFAVAGMVYYNSCSVVRCLSILPLWLGWCI